MIREANEIHIHFQVSVFFLNDTAPPELYPLPLPDALPISGLAAAEIAHAIGGLAAGSDGRVAAAGLAAAATFITANRILLAVMLRLARGHTIRATGLLRSEEHTSELQSQSNLVCRLLLEKK